MTRDERAVDDDRGRRHEECGATLTSPEIRVSREAGHPFLCAVHASEQLPVDAPVVDEPAG